MVSTSPFLPPGPNKKTVKLKSRISTPLVSQKEINPVNSKPKVKLVTKKTVKARMEQNTQKVPKAIVGEVPAVKEEVLVVKEEIPQRSKKLVTQQSALKVSENHAENKTTQNSKEQAKQPEPMIVESKKEIKVEIPKIEINNQPINKSYKSTSPKADRTKMSCPLDMSRDAKSLGKTLRQFLKLSK